ncbi:hypothetical protein GIY62_32310 [Burkholderia plantarii]|uniref:hypothetical protein n=1 Tax=Burkholderia plantarii TaxID=41899 RepID=UPI00272CA6AF|nr:hypothetical protein [Burkholderia plantarii]WLE62087.1 hypothetical protein GIY62_32310 [Burkholderia plantarii]
MPMTDALGNVSRGLFEAAMTRWAREQDTALSFARDGAGCYVQSEARAAWNGWIQACAAVEAQLREREQAAARRFGRDIAFSHACLRDLDTAYAWHRPAGEPPGPTARHDLHDLHMVAQGARQAAEARPPARDAAEAPCRPLPDAGRPARADSRPAALAGTPKEAACAGRARQFERGLGATVAATAVRHEILSGDWMTAERAAFETAIAVDVVCDWADHGHVESRRIDGTLILEAKSVRARAHQFWRQTEQPAASATEGHAS